MAESGPRLHLESRLMSPSRLARLGQRRGSPEFGAALQALVRSAQVYVSVSPVAPVTPVTPITMEPPDQPAGFYHDYFCPDHAVELSFDPRTPDQHRCPDDGRVFSGEPYDSAWRWFVNNRLSTAAFELSLVWRLNGNEACRRRVEAILLGYARCYSRYPPSPERPFGRGRATFQSLDEAVWLIPLIRAYDLIRESMSPKDRRLVELDLIRPAAEHLVGEKYHRLHNIECWHNTAVGAAGLCLDDPDLIRIAIDDEFGFHHQLAEGVRDDGLWWEGSTSYHFYALAALMTMAQMSEGGEEEEAEKSALWRSERLHRMFSAPVDLALGSDLRLPATNDCWFFTSLLGDVCHGVPHGASFYEVAFGWYGDPSFAWVLEHNYRHHHRSRTSLEALLYGTELPFPPGSASLTESASDSRSALDSGSALDCGSASVAESNSAGDPDPRVFASSGLALLRSEDPLSHQMSVLLKYGPHGGGHGHPDKLSISLNTCGAFLSPDLGTPGYGIDLNQTWYRQTISHNTVVVDGRSQPAAGGELVAFESGRASVDARERVRHGIGGPGIVGHGETKTGLADARVQWEEEPYAGVCMRRVVMGMADGYFIDYFEVDCGRERQIDWICRFPAGGTASRESPGWARTELVGDGYEHVSDAVVTDADELQLEWQLPHSSLTLFLPCEGRDNRIIRGAVPANPASERNDLLIRRRQAAATVYLAVFHSWVGEPTVTGVRPHLDLPPGVSGLWIETASGRDLWIIGRPDHQQDLAAAHEGSADRLFIYCLD